MPFVLPVAPKIPPADGIIRNGLISRWPLDDGTGSTIARDDQSSNTGTLQSMDPQTSWVEGRLGPGDVALEFFGNPQHVLINHVSELNPAQITACTWFRLTANPPSWSVLVGKSDGQWNNGYSLFFPPGDVIGFFYGDFAQRALFSFLSSDRDWHLIIGTYDGATTRVYLDDVEGTPVSYVAPPATITEDLRLGFMTGGQYLFGVMQDARIYNRVLNSAERTAIFNGTG